MSASVVAIISVSGGLGGFLGALAPTAWRALSQRLARPGKPRPVRPTRLDPSNLDRVRSISQDWAARQGRPEAAPWAAGFIEDAARFVQRRGGLR